jgi:hypothetical protein
MRWRGAGLAGCLGPLSLSPTHAASHIHRYIFTHTQTDPNYFTTVCTTMLELAEGIEEEELQYRLTVSHPSQASGGCGELGNVRMCIFYLVNPWCGCGLRDDC